MDDPWMPPISMDFCTSSMDIHPDGPRSIHGSPYRKQIKATLITQEGLAQFLENTRVIPNPQGNGEGYVRVGVRVQELSPLTYPYP
jgi:hypothetical protein